MKAIPYIRLEHEDSVSIQKDVLSLEASMLNTLKTIQKYRDTRKKELIKKNKLRISVSKLNKYFKSFLSELPKTGKLPEIKHEELKEDKGKKSIDLELREIQRRLAELG